MNVQSTKAIARKFGVEAKVINEMARDLGIEMKYRADNRYWEIQNIGEAKTFIEHVAYELEAQAEEERLGMAYRNNRHLV